MRPTIVAIVEGEGDKGAIRRLVERWFEFHQVFQYPQVRVLVTHGVAKILAPYNKEKQHGVEYWVDQAQRHGPRAILVLLDSDDECSEAPKYKRPAGLQLGPWLLSRAEGMVGHIPISVVVADRCFESWFLCQPCQQALFEAKLFRKTDLPAPDAHGRWEDRLRSLMGCSYSKSADQVRLANHMPLGEDMAAASRSFRKLQQELMRLCRAVAV